MRRVIDPEPLPMLKGRFSQGMAAGPFVFLAGQIASDFSTGLHPDVKELPGLPTKAAWVKRQAEFVLERQQRVAKAGGTDLARAAQIWSLLTNIGDAGLTRDAQARFFKSDALPARTTFGVEKLTVHGGRIEIDAILAAPKAEREVFPFTDAEARRFGASAAVRVDSFVFVSGLSDPVTDTAAREFPYFVSTVKEQTRAILDRLASILAKAGSSLDHVVKVQVFMPDLSHFAEFEEVWREAFPKNPPARTIIPATLAVPQCVVEINAIAIVSDNPIRKEIVRTDRAPKPSMHEPQAVKAGPFIFLSQLMATDYKTGIPSVARVNPNFPNHESDIRRQVSYILENADMILAAGGSSLKQTVRRQGFYSSFENNLGPARDVTWEAFAPDPSPSTTVSLGTHLLVPGCKYVLDVIAVAS
jgi:enamine deaminase RidA (YjgF/YER057c/UK114 family)